MPTKAVKFSANLSTVILVLPLIFGCSEQRKLKEMHKSTIQMDKTTSKLSNSTDKLLSTISEVYDGGRQGTTLALRHETIKALIEADTTAKKISQAVKYLDSFEFQVWSGFSEGDSLARRQTLIDDATTEFFTDLEEYFSNVNSVDPLARKSIGFLPGNNKQACFNAIAAALGFVNRKQIEMTNKFPQHKVVSMLSIIEQALRDEALIASGIIPVEAISAATNKVLSNKPEAIMLLQTRHNMLSLLTLAKVSPLGQSGHIMDFLRVRFKSWTTDLNSLNLSTLMEGNHFLKEALSTIEFLKSIGVEPYIDGSVSTSWRHGKFVFGSSHSTAQTSTFVELQRQFVSSVALYRQNLL